MAEFGLSLMMGAERRERVRERKQTNKAVNQNEMISKIDIRKTEKTT